MSDEPAQSSVESNGYKVVRKGETVASFWCSECLAGTCDCLLDAMARARKCGAGTRVYGPTGAELSRRERT